MATTARKTPTAKAAPSKSAASKTTTPTRATKAPAPAPAATTPNIPPAKSLGGKGEAKAAPKGQGKSALKLVRDSFTMPALDFSLIAVLKERAVKLHRPAKKSELLRAGLHALAALDDARLKAALDALIVIKTGRPKKG